MREIIASLAKRTATMPSGPITTKSSPVELFLGVSDANQGPETEPPATDLARSASVRGLQVALLLLARGVLARFGYMIPRHTPSGPRAIGTDHGACARGDDRRAATPAARLTMAATPRSLAPVPCR